MERRFSVFLLAAKDLLGQMHLEVFTFLRLGSGLSITHTPGLLPTFLNVQNGSLFSGVLVGDIMERKMDAQ